MNIQQKLLEPARIALLDCLGLGKAERLLVVTDDPCLEIGQALYTAAIPLCKEVVLVKIKPRHENGNEPPEPVGEWFGQFDVAIMPTSKSLSHTQARRAACAKGTRIATLPGITSEIFIRTMKADWKKLGSFTRRIASQMSKAQSIRVTNKAGTDISFLTGGRTAKPDDGRIMLKGAFGNLPAGEAYLAPLEGTAEGTVVFDGSFGLGGIAENPLILTVKKGKVVKTEGSASKDLEALFIKYRNNARNIAEFGVGTLDTARITGNTLEDEKVKGTIHIAVGDNASMGGKVKVPLHLDGIVTKPNVWLDGVEWMVDGEMV